MRNKHNSLTKRWIMLSASNMGLQLMGFAYRIALGRLAGAEGMGVSALAMQVYSVLYSVCVSGISVAVTGMSARVYVKRGAAGVDSVVRFALCVLMSLLLPLAFGVLALREQIAADVLCDTRTADALWLIPICILLTGVENVMKSALFGMNRVKTASLSEFIEQTIRYSLVILLLLSFGIGEHRLSAFLIMLGMTLSEIFSVSFLTVSYMKALRTEKSRLCSQKVFSRKRFMAIAAPSVATSASATLLSSASTVVFPARLKKAGFSAESAVGMLGRISGMAEPLMCLPAAFVGALCAVLMPEISASHENGDIRCIRNRVRKAFLTAGAFGLLTAAVIPFAPRLCEILFSETLTPKLAALIGIKTIVGYFLAVTVSVMNGIYEHKRVLLNAVCGEALQFLLIWALTAMPALNVYGYMLGMIIGDGLRLAMNAAIIMRRTLKKRPSV